MILRAPQLLIKALWAGLGTGVRWLVLWVSLHAFSRKDFLVTVILWGGHLADVFNKCFT